MRDICHFACYKFSTTATTATTITQRAFKKNEYDCFNSAFAGAGRDCYDHLIACPGNALQGPARRTGTPPPPASHVATGCPWTSRLQLLCIKQIETSASMLQKKAGSETMRADRLQIALHAARRLIYIPLSLALSLSLFLSLSSSISLSLSLFQNGF